MEHTPIRRICAGLIASVTAVFLAQWLFLQSCRLWLPDFPSHPMFPWAVSAAGTFLGALPIFFLAVRRLPSACNAEERPAFPPQQMLLLLLLCPCLLFCLRIGSFGPVPDPASLPYGFLLGCILLPVGEELLFRRLLMDRMKRLPLFWSAGFSAFVFSLFHLEFTQFPFTFVLGLLFAFAYGCTGTLFAPVLLHGFTNLWGYFLFPRFAASAAFLFPGSLAFLSASLRLICLVLSIGLWGAFCSMSKRPLLPAAGRPPKCFQSVWLFSYVLLCLLAALLSQLIS